MIFWGGVGSGSSVYGFSLYSPNGRLGYGHYQSSSGKIYSLSVLELQATGKYIHGIAGHRLGVQYAMSKSTGWRGLGTGLGYATTLYSGYLMYKEPNVENGLSLTVGVAGIFVWPIGVMGSATLPTAFAGKAQIKHNIMTNEHPLNNTINPTTGEFYVPGYFSGF